MNTKRYFLGLDMGTNSIGWAVTDDKYQLIRVKGKDFWGIREFDEASPASDRRAKRIGRRRRQKEVVRIGLLQSYFHAEIEKEDPLFFIRLENSKYYPEDKDEKLKSPNGIFNDTDYKDSDYYKQYPTIFHLRKDLIEDTVPFDKRYARLLYLALLNMYKHRGHFLESGISDSQEAVSVKTLYPDFVRLADSLLAIGFPSEAAPDIEQILSDRSISRSQKADKLAVCCGFGKADKKQKLLLKALCGLKIDANKLFELEKEEKIELCFSDSGYDDNVDKLMEDIGEENFELVEVMKQIYDAGRLADILCGCQYLSMARVEEYKKHHEDLKLLKEVMKEYCTEAEYDEMFRKTMPESYSAYVNSANSSEFNGTNYNGERKPSRRSMEERTREGLYKTIRQHVKDIEDDRVSYIRTEMEKESFLPKQRTAGNGVIPNQVHKKEMAAILDNAEKYLPFLKEKDESGLTVSERILRLFSFVIPYYIGPTSRDSVGKGKNGWVVRKEDGQVLPWNIDEKIDREKTSEEFINRLIRSCTYIQGEKVLPKASLAYEAYCVLNEINNLKVRGEKLPVYVKQEIYTELFCKGKKVTRKQIEKYLLNKGVLTSAEELAGIDTQINNSLSSYGKLYAIFGEEIKTDACREKAERIIYLSTVYSGDKKLLKARLEKEFGGILSSDKIKRILGYKWKDWGRFSKELLLLPGCNKETGEIKSLLRTMWETNENFMELLHSDRYTFMEELHNRQCKSMASLAEFQEEDLREFYFSAPVRRMLWQTILIIKEVEKVMGNPPEHVFIEMTRSNDAIKGDRGRTSSRKKQLLELYRNIKDETRDWEKEIELADEKGSLRSKKLFLYYLQMGRCMYTGKLIDLEDLFTTKYDIDHIYPRHFVKDDNISNNLVLVNKSSNAYKSDKYPLEQMPQEVYDLWKRLHDARLISNEKYNRLTRRTPFTESEKANFIARQLVETSQGTKGAADLLKQLLPAPETTVIYVKAGNVSDFRNEFNLLKSRTVNDFHHAKDAYLNIVVGNVYDTKFTRNPLNFIKNELAQDKKKYHYNLGKMYEWNVERNGRTAWIATDELTGEPGTIAVVRKVMERNTPMISRMTFEAKGAIAKETLYAAKKAKEKIYIPLKASDSKMQDVTKYGGFTSVSGAYFFLVEHDEKKKRVRTLEVLPIYAKDKVEARENGLLEYCIETLGLKNPDIRLSRIKMQSLLSIEGFKTRISGRTGNQITLRNEMSLCFNQEWVNYIHAIDKYMERKQLPDIVKPDKNVELYQLLIEKHANTIFAKRPNPVGKKLRDGLEKFLKRTTEEQCEVINEILKLSMIGVAAADLSKIGGSANDGKMRINKKLDHAKEYKLINQSVTGVYERAIDLLTV